MKNKEPHKNMNILKTHHIEELFDYIPILERGNSTPTPTLATPRSKNRPFSKMTHLSNTSLRLHALLSLQGDALSGAREARAFATKLKWLLLKSKWLLVKTDLAFSKTKMAFSKTKDAFLIKPELGPTLEATAPGPRKFRFSKNRKRV